MPKIIVVGDGDIDVFGSVSEAEKYLEPIDVENGEVSLVMDRSGQSYLPTVATVVRKGWLLTRRIPSVRLVPVAADKQHNKIVLANMLRSRMQCPQDTDPDAVIGMFMEEAELTP